MFTVMGSCKLAASLLLLTVVTMASHHQYWGNYPRDFESSDCPKGNDPKLCPFGSFNYTEDDSLCRSVPYCYRGLNEPCRTGDKQKERCQKGLTCSCRKCQNCVINRCFNELCPNYKNNDKLTIAKRLMKMMQVRHQMAYPASMANQLEYQPPVVPINEWDYQPAESDEQLYQM